MLALNWWMSPWLIGAALLAVLAVLVVRAFIRDRREYEVFKRFRSTERRQKMLRKWLIESICYLGGSAALLLLLGWQFIGPMLAQIEEWSAMIALRNLFAEGGSFAKGLLIGIAIAFFVGLVASVVFSKHEGEVPTIGDIHALLPRNRAEIKYGVGLSINAGIVEELLFRLALPTAIFAISGNALVAVIASILIFGAMHAYQGIGGIIGTTIFGALMMFIFLTTGTILWPILLHAVFDLRSLVLIPIAVYKVHKVAEGEEKVAEESVELEAAEAAEPSESLETDQ